MIVSSDDAEILAGINDVRVARVGDDVTSFATPDTVPIGERDAARASHARSLRGAEILHRTGDVIGRPGVDGHVIELADGQGWRLPGLARIRRDVHTTIIGGD